MVSNVASAGPEVAEEWRLVEELRIGRLSGSGPDAFADIHDLAVDGGGRIYVLDVGWREVRVFDRDGRYLRSMAREGDGPGEKRYSNQLAGRGRIVWQAPNRLWVGDRSQQLLLDSLGNELGRSGGTVATLAWDPKPMTRVVGTDTLGSVYRELTHISFNSSVGRQELHVARLPVSAEHEILSGDTLLIELRPITLGEGRTRETRRDAGRIRGGTTNLTTAAAAEPRVVWAAGPGGTVWLANRSARRFHEVNFDGDTLRTVELGTPPPLPERGEKESDMRPVLAALEVSPEGWLWAEREPGTGAEAGSTWDLLDNCGRYRGMVAASAELEALHFGAGGGVFGVVSDNLDVDYVLHLRLEGETGALVIVESCPPD